MPSKQPCVVCSEAAAKYVCPSCDILYCSLKCFKEHQASDACCSKCQAATTQQQETPSNNTCINEKEDNKSSLNELSNDKPLLPLSSLKWPYIPEEPSFQDAFKANEPKPLQLNQYERIAYSAQIRDTLRDNAQLRSLLQKVDTLRGVEREDAFEFLLGVDSHGGHHGRVPEVLQESANQDSLKSFKELAKILQNTIEDPGQQKGLSWD